MVEQRLLYFIALVIVCCRESCAQICVSGDLVGASSPSSLAQDVAANTNESVLVIGASSEYTVACCGFVSSYELSLDVQAQPSVDLHLQFWRSVTGQYQLVGQNTFTVTSNGLNTISVPAAERISVTTGDVMGWYSISSVIQRKASLGQSYLRTGLSGPDTVGDIVDWTSVGTADTTYSYAIRANLVTNNAPAFTSPASGTTFTIREDTVMSTVVTNIAYSDVDSSDILTLSHGLNGTTQFNHNTTSGDVYVNTAGLTVGAISLTFTVTDACSNTASLSITINVTSVVTTTTAPGSNNASSGGLDDEVVSLDTVFIIGLSVAGGTLLVFIVFVICCLVCTWRKKRKQLRKENKKHPANDSRKVSPLQPHLVTSRTNSRQAWAAANYDPRRHVPNAPYQFARLVRNTNF